MKIMNSAGYGDFHLHSSTLSDGLNSIDEIAVQAGLMDYTKIAITDHNREYLYRHDFKNNTHYSIIASGRWKNIHNSVEIVFGVEADLLNENGDICHDIQSHFPEFIVLSAHEKIYSGSPGSIKQAYLNAIERHGSKINVLGHLCVKQFADRLTLDDMADIVAAANRAGIALELNCANLTTNKTSLPHLNVMLSACQCLYVNSDAHTLHELKSLRQTGFSYLKDHGFL